MAIESIAVSSQEVQKLLLIEEGHFSELKAKEIKPAKLTKSISAFSNAEGGELYVGISENKQSGDRSWEGFVNFEAANGHLQAFESLFPLGEGYAYSFLRCQGFSGYVLKVDIKKNRNVVFASDKVAYIRRGAQSLPANTDEMLDRLRKNKGISSFETELIPADCELLTKSIIALKFMLEVVPTSEPEQWLAKQQLLVQKKPTVAGIVLFAEEPQAVLPKRTGIKVYRYKTAEKEGTRDTLARDPLSIEGHAYRQIFEGVACAASIVQSVRVNTADGLQSLTYPTTALHEVITNAVLHRDYSIADDIHIRIFDNRIEVDSPGTLPGHVTPENILNERCARNPSIVRLINKFPNPPNKDVGEGLNTAFQAMRDMKLKAPVVSQEGGYVRVSLRHEPLATPEELIFEYLQKNAQITNRIARDMCFIGSENKMKGILQRMVKNGHIELVPGTTRYSAAYRLAQSV
jgi:ATP-dependent DNA helicase RecG